MTQQFAYKPHPGKQTEFLKCTADEILFGGARGGSKSFSLSYKAAFQVRKFHYEFDGEPITKAKYIDLKHRHKRTKKLAVVIDKISIDYPEYQAILIRRTYPDLVKNIKVECDKLYPMYGARWIERDHCYIFPSGAKVFLDHCQDQKALDQKYIGLNMHFIGIDEANQFPNQHPKKWVTKIAMNLRTANRELKPQLALTSNPGNIGHAWLKEDFVEKCKPVNDGPKIFNETFKITYQPKKSGEPYTDEDGVTYQFIPSTVWDNPSIYKNDPNYIRKLKKLPKTLRRMWLDGDWDCAPGMYFDNWNYMHHVIPEELFKYGTHFSKETHQLYRVYDYGTKAPFVCLFAALDRDNNLIFFDEIVETGLSSSKQAQLVAEYTLKKYGLTSADFESDYCDPAYFSKTTEKLGEVASPADYYEDEGIILEKANNDRKAGAKLVYQNLDIPDDEESIPRIRFTSNCTSTIKYLPILPSASNDPEDVDTDAWDHEYDCVRYLSMEVLEPADIPDDPKQLGWRDRLKQNKSKYEETVPWMAV